MSNVLPFPNEREIADAAGLWIARLDRGLSSAELAQLRAWLEADRRHRDALFEMAGLWDRMDLLGEMSELFPLEAPRVPPEIRRAHRLFGGGRLRLAPAMMLLLVPLLGLASWLAIQQFKLRAFEATYQTQVGEQRTIKLPDKSVVMLNTATLMKVHYSERVRAIELVSGEAHFQVAKNAERVFSVHAGANEFRAIGTAFDVRFAPEGGAALTVTEGRVQVLISPSGESPSVDGAAIANDIARRARPLPIAHPITEIMVDAGKEVAIDATTQTVKRLDPSQVEAAMAWQHGMILFEGQPLEEAIREVSRYSNVQFRIDQEQIRHLPVSGYFKVGDIEALVSSLKNNFNIQATREGNLIALRARQK